MMVCRASRWTEKGATSSSDNQGRRRMGGRENTKQAVDNVMTWQNG